MANRMAVLDSDLKERYNHDINWNLLPTELREVSKAYQQQASPPSMLNILFLCHHGHQWLTSWSILSPQICSLYGKGMKQRVTTVSLGILTMISFRLGHASIEVNDFWTEPVITSRKFSIRRIERIDRIDKVSPGPYHNNIVKYFPSPTNEMQFSDRQLHLSDRQ